MRFTADGWYHRIDTSSLGSNNWQSRGAAAGTVTRAQRSSGDPGMPMASRASLSGGMMQSLPTIWPRGSHPTSGGPVFSGRVVGSGIFGRLLTRLPVRLASLSSLSLLDFGWVAGWRASSDSSIQKRDQVEGRVLLSTASAAKWLERDHWRSWAMRAARADGRRDRSRVHPYFIVRQPIRPRFGLLMVHVAMH
jgi:hypothetical protein